MIFISAKVFEFGSPEYNELLPEDQRQPGSRAIIWIDIHKVGSVSASRFIFELSNFKPCLTASDSPADSLFHFSPTKAHATSCTSSLVLLNSRSMISGILPLTLQPERLLRLHLQHRTEMLSCPRTVSKTTGGPRTPRASMACLASRMHLWRTYP